MTFRVILIVFWTFILIAGVAVAVIVSVPNLADLLAGASQATLGAKTAAAAAAVAMFLIGLWGITSSHRAMTHALQMAAEVDRARKETIQLETARITQFPK